MTRDPLVVHGGLFVGLSVGAVLLALLWPGGGAPGGTAAAGAAVCALSGAVALAFKGRAQSLNGALLAVVVLFGARVFLVTVGATLAYRWGGRAAPFIWGFFGTYFPLQWIEISYLVAVAKQAKSQQGAQLSETAERR